MKILDELDRALTAVTNWRNGPMDQVAAAGHDARAFEGSANGWRFVIVDFEIESQCFPKGSRGWDGMATNDRGVIVRLPRPMAARGLRLAMRGMQ